MSAKFVAEHLKVEEKLLGAGSLELTDSQLVYEGDGKKVVLFLDHVQLYGTVTPAADDKSGLKWLRLDFDAEDAILGDVETTRQAMDEEAADEMVSVSVEIAFKSESDITSLFNRLGKVMEKIDEQKAQNSTENDDAAADDGNEEETAAAGEPK